MTEGLVAEVAVRRVADDHGVDRVQGRVDEVEGDVGCRDGGTDDDNALEPISTPLIMPSEGGIHSR